MAADSGRHGTRQDWRKSLTRAQDEQAVRRLRLCTTRGRPLGNDSFVAKLERSLGRRLRALPDGRPREDSKTKN